MNLTLATARHLWPCYCKVRGKGHGGHGNPARLVGGDERFAYVQIRKHGSRVERLPWSRVTFWKSRNPHLARNDT